MAPCTPEFSWCRVSRAARKLTAQVPQLAVPETVVEALESDPAAGVLIACDLVRAIHASGAFDGVHLIPIARYREIAARLEPS